MVLDVGGEIEKGAEFYWLNAGKSTQDLMGTDLFNRGRGNRPRIK
jgi:hypothetical protein